MDAAGLKAILENVYPDISAIALASLAPHFVQHSFKAGHHLLLPGQQWDTAMVIQSGLIRLYFLRRDGREFNKNFFAENAVVCPLTPHMWEEPSLFGIACIESTIVWTCRASLFRQVLSAQEDWQQLQRELLVGLLNAKLQREHDLLTLDGRRRYEMFLQRFPSFAQRVPLTHLATYLGLTDVSLSRLRRQIREEAEQAP